MSRDSERWIITRRSYAIAAVVLAIVILAAASAVFLVVRYIDAQQPPSLALRLRKQVLANQADYERIASVAITVARVRQGELKASALPASDRWMESSAKVDGIMTVVQLPGNLRWMSASGTANVESHGTLGYAVRFGISSGILGEGVDLVYAPHWSSSDVRTQVGEPYPVLPSWFLVYSS